MAFTSADLSSVETAIRSLISSTGPCIVEVQIGQDRIKYKKENLPDLLVLRNTIANEVNRASGSKKYRYIQFRRGF